MLKRKITWYFIFIFMLLVLFFWWVVAAESDLLYEAIKPSQDLIIFPSKNSKRVFNRVFKGSKEIDIEVEKDGGGYELDTYTVDMRWWLFVKVTRLLLILVVVLSVTMILYNWIKYIVKVWQGEDSKSLLKNVAYIVVWILISLFSVIIITLLRSVPKTITDEKTGIQKNVDIDREEVLWLEEK